MAIKETHHVKNMGSSKRTDCGIYHVNRHVWVTQDGTVTCKDCIKFALEVQDEA